MARMRLLDLARPFSLVLPEIELPYQKIAPLERALFTVAAALIYVLLAEVSLTSVKTAVDSPDPISWLRAPLAMSHGTPAELGVFPIVLSGMIFQILAGLRKISVSLDVRSERSLFQSLQKLVALVISAVFAVILAFSPGVFGSDHLVATRRSQLMVAGEIFLGSASTVYMDELLSKGYGLVSGTVLFTLITTSQKFVWSAFSLQSVEIPGKYGWATYGVLPSLFFNVTSRSLGYTITDFVFRGNGLPNLVDLVVAVSVFLGVLYLSMLRFNLQIRSTRMRAQSSSFPVRLLYTGVQPVLFVAALVASFLLFSYGLDNLLGPDNIVTKIVGVWHPATATPVSGLAALLVPKFTGSSPIYVVLRTVVYPLLFGFVGAWVGNTWTQSSGFAPQDIAKSFKENSIVLVGKRDTSAVKELRKIIPLAATLGGGILGLVVAEADMVGPSGWGLAMSVASLNLLAVFEQLAQDGIISADGMPQLV